MSLKVCCITCTAGRLSCLRRNVRMFLEQDYENAVQLIFQNSSSPLQLGDDIPEGKVIIVNCPADLQTGEKYKTLGAIYRDALTFVPEDVDVINHFDDDDFFLPQHISLGVDGLKRGNSKAYKAKKSIFLQKGLKPILTENVMEPSIFVMKEHVQKYGYGQETSAQHLQWVEPLIKEGQLFADPEGIPTLAYNWNALGETVFKTSGDPKNPNNFTNYHRYSQDFGQGTLSPVSKQEIEIFYNKIKP